jgi:hypothetical protein
MRLRLCLATILPPVTFGFSIVLEAPDQCPLLEAKRTLLRRAAMSVFDPKRTLGLIKRFTV